MKRPELKFDKPNVKVPPVVENVYRDLRDRKLLPLVVLLLVAIIAVPVALSASASTPSSTAAPVAEVVPADAPEAQAAVLAENPGLRDYRERLDALKSQNPFDQQFETSGLAGTEVESGSDSVESITESGGAPVSGGGDTGAVTDTSGGSTTTSSPDTSSSSGGSVESTETVEPEIFFYTFKVDLQYGLEGDVKERRNVKLLDMLSPVGTFLGASADASLAVFALSSNVTAATGDGECSPSPESCDFLLLEKGQSAALTYQLDGAEIATYRLGVDDIRVVKVKNPPTVE
jgi:hypothetical protein